MSSDISALTWRHYARAGTALQRLSGALVDHSIRLTSLQLDATTAFLQFGLEQFRSLQMLVDSSTYRDYLAHRQELLDALSARLSGDADGIASLQRGFAEEVGKITQENVISFAAAVEERNQRDAGD